MLKNIWLAWILILAVPAWADYRTEWNLGLSDTEENTRTQFDYPGTGVPLMPSVLPISSTSYSKTDSDTASLGGTLYFGSVENKGVPYAEMGFLSKQGKFSANFRQEKGKTRSTSISTAPIPSNPQTATSESLRIDLSSDYVIPKIPIIIGVATRFDESKSKISGTPEVKYDVRELAVKFGMYVTDNGAITYEYADVHGEIDVPNVIGGSDFDGTSQTLRYYHVFPIFESQFISLSLSASESKTENSESDGKSIGFTYYPLPSLSVGYVQSKSDFRGGGSELKSNAFQVRYFLNESLSFRLSSENADTKNGNDVAVLGATVTSRMDREGIFLGANYRY